MKILFIACCASIMAMGCKSYVLTKGSMVEQLRANQKIGEDPKSQKYALVDYPSNNLTKINCVDKNGNCITITPDKNTGFTIVKKDGKKVEMYFDTVLLVNDTIQGLKSRLVGGRRAIPLADIERAEISPGFHGPKPCR